MRILTLRSAPSYQNPRGGHFVGYAKKRDVPVTQICTASLMSTVPTLLRFTGGPHVLIDLVQRLGGTRFELLGYRFAREDTVNLSSPGTSRMSTFSMVSKGSSWRGATWTSGTDRERAANGRTAQAIPQ